MSKLTVPNNIVDGTLVEASEHQQNYQQIESFVNNQVIHADGSVAMDAGSELLLGAAASVPQGAVTKAQLENAVGGDVAGGGFLPLAGGTITGNLVVTGSVSAGGSGGKALGVGNDVELHDINAANTLGVYGIQDSTVGKLKLGSNGPLLAGAGGVLSVNGKEVYTKAKADDQIYTKKEIDDLLAARPLMRMCDKPTRVYDQEGGKKALTWHKIQLPATVGGISRSGAKAAYVNMASVNAARNSWIAVRPDGSNWDPYSSSQPYSTLNITTGEIENEHFLTTIGSNGAIQFWIHGDSTSVDGVDRLVLDVIALVF